MSVTIKCIGANLDVTRIVSSGGSADQKSLSTVYVVECEVQGWETFPKSSYGDIVGGRMLHDVRDTRGYSHNDGIYSTVMVRDVIDDVDCCNGGVYFFMTVGEKVVRIRAFPVESFDYDLVNDKNVCIHFTIAEWMLRKIAHKAAELSNDQFDITFFEDGR